METTKHIIGWIFLVLGILLTLLNLFINTKEVIRELLNVLKSLLIIVFAILLLTSCKKNNITPSSPKPCTKQSEIFSGTYVAPNIYGFPVKHDTITITYQSVNCPNSNSDVYLVHGLGKLVKDYCLDSTNIPYTDVTIISDETLGNPANNSNNTILIYKTSNTSITVYDYKANGNTSILLNKL